MISFSDKKLRFYKSHNYLLISNYFLHLRTRKWKEAASAAQHAFKLRDAYVATRCIMRGRWLISSTLCEWKTSPAVPQSAADVMTRYVRISITLWVDLSHFCPLEITMPRLQLHEWRNVPAPCRNRLNIVPQMKITDALAYGTRSVGRSSRPLTTLSSILKCRWFAPQCGYRWSSTLVLNN